VETIDQTATKELLVLVLEKIFLFNELKNLEVAFEPCLSLCRGCVGFSERGVKKLVQHQDDATVLVDGLFEGV
jgi:hypothetical protein